MTIKTFTRARAAVAAARKFLEEAGLEAFVDSIEGFESGAEPGRFGAKVALKSGAGREIENSIIAKGFGVAIKVRKDEPVVVDEATPVAEIPLPPVEEGEAEPQEGAEPPARKTAYIHGSSSMKGACRLVHETASQMVAKNPQATRKEVIAACVAKGVAFGTARTQYQAWKSGKK